MPHLPAVAPRRLAAIALIVLLAGACGSAEPSRSDPPVEDDPSAVASVGVTSALAEFEGELRDAMSREGALIRELTTASVGSADDLTRATSAMRAWSDRERAWLRQHPPEPCYDAAAKKLEAALDAMTTAADQFDAVTAESPAPSDDAAFAPAMNALQAASRGLADAATNAKANRPNCR